MPRELKLEFNSELDINEIFDEGTGNSFLALRSLRWTPNSPFKLDIRKWFTNSEGEEIAGKGVSFITEEGPNNLINALMKHGYGDTRGILDQLKDRDDFLVAVKETLQNNNLSLDDVEVPSLDSLNEAFYDPKQVL